jgi:tRNA-splicing ligase RtcB
MELAKVHALGCDLSGEQTQYILNKILGLKSIALPLVCLPDLHVKQRTEGPSSFAAATNGTIVPELTAPSVGCGMGIVATNLTVKNLNNEIFEKFFNAMQENLGPRYGLAKNFLLWLGIKKRPKKKYDISVEELKSFIREGAPAAIKKYGFAASMEYNIEYGGSVFSEEEKLHLRFQDILPRSSFKNGLHDLGYGFKGNHFLEIQYVEEILDGELAATWGLKENQMVIMYHGGGGIVPYHVGRYYGNRKKNSPREKVFLFVLKILFHLFGSRGIKFAPKRLRYYIFPQEFQEIPLESEEGKRLMLAIKAASNYSYAFRVAIVRRIVDSLQKTLEKKDIEVNLIWDTTHNSIMKEDISGKEVIVHRHTATRTFEGKPVIISGFNTTNSYIGVGLPNAEQHLFSADHGAGETIKKFEEKNLTSAHPKNFTTHIYRTKPPFKRIVSHITNEGLDYVMENLQNEGITRPIVRLRPLAVFKG